MITRITQHPKTKATTSKHNASILSAHDVMGINDFTHSDIRIPSARMTAKK
jgi:hypothetical protein